jgi:hypothetical protein
VGYGQDKDGNCAWHRTDNAQLFIVENTSGKREYLVAASFHCARWLALWGGHLRDIDNGNIFSVKQDWLNADQPFRSALRRAVKAGFPGLIKRIGDAATILESRDHCIVGQVYTPISSVKT